MNYSEKLRDPRWQKKRLEILNRDNFTCKYCEDKETELQIHHLKYSGNPWDAPNEDLTTLCKRCHSVISNFSLRNIMFSKKHIRQSCTYQTFFFTEGHAAIFISRNHTYLAEHLITFTFDSEIIHEIFNFYADCNVDKLKHSTNV